MKLNKSKSREVGQSILTLHKPPRIIDLVGQAGSVHSTAADMNKYLRHIIENNGSRYADLVSFLFHNYNGV